MRYPSVDGFMLKSVCDTKDESLKQLDRQNAGIMRVRNQLATEIQQLDATLKKMEKDKLASEERTKKILSAVREGLHKLSDMRDEVPAEGPGQPGLSTFYNHIEEIITTDDWGDDDVYTKGVVEEIQVSVQKLARPTVTSERVTFQPKTTKLSSETQTEFPPPIPPAEMDALKSGYETRIFTLEETVISEKRISEQKIYDQQQQITKLLQKVDADRKFIEELSSEREADRDETLKLTRNLENTWRENENITEKLNNLRQTNEDTENQLKIATAQNELLENIRKRFADELQMRNEQIKQKDDLITDLERQLSDKMSCEEQHRRQLENLKLELSGFLRSPPLSPEPETADMSHSLDDLRKQVMDLKDELAVKNRSTVQEHERLLTSLQQELKNAKKSEEKGRQERETLEQQVSALELEAAGLRRQLDVSKFQIPDEDVVEQLNARLAMLQKEMEGCQRVIEGQESELLSNRTELESVQMHYEELLGKWEKLNSEHGAVSREDLLRQMEQFEYRNKFLTQQLEETAQMLDDQQRLWERELTHKSAEIVALKNELAENHDLTADLESVRVQMGDLKRLLDEAEKTAREKSLYADSLKNLVDIMKTEAAQKDAAVKALQKQFNDNSSSLARQLEEVEKMNSSMLKEVEVYRNAPNQSIDFDSIILEKDTEISRLRDLVEASLDDSLITSKHVLSLENNTQTENGLSFESVEIQVDLLDDTQLLAEIADLHATVRELEHKIVQKNNQMEALAAELASLNDRHGKTQTKFRTTIQYLNQSGHSSSDEGTVTTTPTKDLGETSHLVEKYEEKLREMEKTHIDEMERLVHESLSVLQNQSVITPNANDSLTAPHVNGSTREISPGSFSLSSNDDSTLNDAPLSDTLQRALRELRNGSEAILKASIKINNGAVSENAENWPAERDLLVAKINFFRDTINQLVLSRDSMEMALRHLEQQNEDLRAELEMLRKEDEMADEGKTLLLTMLKKTESELAELQARYRQRDVRLEIEQAGREREEREREKLQKELRDTEVQLVRIRGELRQKEAQWERERILTMWKKESAVNGGAEEVEHARSLWKGKCIRAESYRKNLTHQKRYLITLIDDLVLNTTDELVKRLALDGIRPTSIRGPGGSSDVKRPEKRRFKTFGIVVCAVIRLQITRMKWQQIRQYS
ncbi:putative protein tag-278 isoform X2 [Paramacrobiotus metropolitanus]|uniref:putative protein tag-278 isoform X2 n=1 Tax=Paramacrobiotus metropolitanus TaxID=2943436 RepID=UPI0024458FFB|nr:putative protein tag-278 isoform X2 [Paramacrobiotus metropolitanus]